MQPLAMLALTLTLLLASGGIQRVQGSSPSDSHYVAAVVDYAPVFASALPAEQNMLQNIKALGAFMSNASAQNADIIVFPEIGLIGLGNLPFYIEVPDPKDSVNPCSKYAQDHTNEVTRELSCLAREHRMYLVVNLSEKCNCSSSDTACQPDGTFHYDTNVVFDRSGLVIARYRKWNVYDKFSTQTTPEVEYVTFNTDFGVEFGTFTCFDIIYEKPGIVLARDRGVTDFVFPSAWFSEVPFLTAVQVQAAWAYAMNVNFLASGYNDPPTGSGGSGIYRGNNGALETVFSGVTGLSSLLVQRVPKKGYWPEGDAAVDPSLLEPVLAYAGADPYLEMQAIAMNPDHYGQFSTELLQRPAIGQEVDVERRLCSHGLCCDFRVTARGVNPFRMASAAASVHHSLFSYFLLSGGDGDPAAFNLTEAEDDFDGFHYRLAVFQGVRSYAGGNTGGVQLCGLMSCLNEDLDSCGYIGKGLSSPLDTWTEFSNVTISGSFATGRLYMPDTEVGPRYRVLPPSSYYWDAREDAAGTTSIHMHLQRSVTDLRTMAIYGRVFDWDGNPLT